jgi:hypothetical protein
MPTIDVSEIRRLIREHLPARYEPLQLTFTAKVSSEGDDHVVIGDDYGTELRVLLRSGAVYSVDPERGLPVRFVNSSVDRLGQFIRIYQSYAGRAKDDRAVANVAGKLKEELASLDPPAFADPENWWALVLEQTADGLLLRA